MITRRYPIVLFALLLCALAGVGGASAQAPAHAASYKHSKRHKHGHGKTNKRKKRHTVSALPSMGPEPSPSIFGIDAAVLDSSHANYVTDIPAARQLGARWDHITLGAGTGSGNFVAADYEVKQARDHGMGIILSFGGIAGACSIRPQPADVHACPPTTGGDLAAYQAYVREVLLRYRNVVTYYESWTEPNNKSSFYPGPNPAQYAAILKAQYAVFQSANSQYGLHLKLLFGSPIGFNIGPGTSGWIAALPFTEVVLDDLGGQRAFDGIALHPYRYPPADAGPSAEQNDYVAGISTAPGAQGPFPAEGCDTSPWCYMTWPQELSAYEQEFANHGYGQQPLWLTEFGWSGTAQPSGGYYPSYETQATYLREAYDDLLTLPFVQGALWFNLRDYQAGLVTGDPAFYYHYGLLKYDFSQKPAAAAFQALARANPNR